MDYVEAAIKILRAEGQPLHYEDIAALASRRRLVETDADADAPPDSVADQLYTSIKRARKLAEPPVFYLAAPATFGLTEWQDSQGGLPDPAELGEARLSYKQAAIEVLEHAQRPLHYREITRRALEQDLIRAIGLTPEHTMASQLYVDVKRRGVASPFQKMGGGRFGLTQWEPDISDIQRAVQRRWVETANQLLDAIRQMEPAAFEALIARLLGLMGYENPVVVGRSGDGGVDVMADIEVGVHRLRTAVQVKRQARNVQRSVVSQLRGDMALIENVDHGTVITTAGFSQGAIQAARVPNRTPILLIDGEWLTELLIEHGIGVKVETIQYITFDEQGLHRPADE